MNNKVLIIEDDKEISSMVKMYLENEGYEVFTAFDGLEGLEAVNEFSPTVILLDLMMPRMDGMECLKKIREKSTTPVLITSAKNSDLDKALGLGFGADDYIQKPFSVIELVARIKAIIRRTHQYIAGSAVEEKENLIKIQGIEVDLESYIVKKNGEVIQLTNKEFEMFKLFIKNPKRVFTKAQIYSLVWEEEYYGDENVINVHIRRLREKIEEDPSKPTIIKTLWGIGYKYEGE